MLYIQSNVCQVPCLMPVASWHLKRTNEHKRLLLNDPVVFFLLLQQFSSCEMTFVSADVIKNMWVEENINQY